MNFFFKVQIKLRGWEYNNAHGFAGNLKENTRDTNKQK